MKNGFITEKYMDHGVEKERVILFSRKDQKFMATWDGKLIPHECAKCLIERLHSSLEK